MALTDKYPSISITMSAHNEGANVKKTIDTIVERTFYPNYDIVLHDDASDDGCCDGFEKYPQVTVIRTKDRHGVGGSKSIAIEAGKGDILFSIDAHVFPEDYLWLVKMVEAMKSLDYKCLLAPLLQPVNVPTWTLRKNRIPVLTSVTNAFKLTWSDQADMSLVTQPVSAIRGIAKMITREHYYKTLGRFDRALSYGGEESDVSLRAWITGLSVAYAPGVTVGHVFKGKSQFLHSHAEDLTCRLRSAFKCMSDEGFQQIKENNLVWMQARGDWAERVYHHTLTQWDRLLKAHTKARDATRARSSSFADEVFERFNIPLTGEVCLDHA